MVHSKVGLHVQIVHSHVQLVKIHQHLAQLVQAELFCTINPVHQHAQLECMKMLINAQYANLNVLLAKMAPAAYRAELLSF